MKVKSLRKIKNIRNKKVFLRLDLNVPLKKGKVLDDFKIAASLPTIRYLLRYNCRIIIASHLEPVGGEKNTSLRGVANRLAEMLGKKVAFVPDCIGEKAEKAAEKLRFGEILVLENLRARKGEKANDRAFARSLAELVCGSCGSRTKRIFNKLSGKESEGIYVNDSFGVDHRKHASVSAIKKYLPAYAGLLVLKEIENLNRAMNPARPAVAIVGGAKISTKISLIKSLLPKYDAILIGGAMANNFFAAQGMEVGKSLVSKEDIALAGKLIPYVLKKKIILPVDVIASSGKTKPVIRRVTPDKVKKSECIFDIGPETVKLYAKHIREAKTIIWNGPMGKFEERSFSHGTMAIASVVGSRSSGHAFGIAGGGETMDALKKSRMMEYLDWASTGGGAMLSYLGREKMPGLEGIVK
ncbi:MAG: phosphoglycerate kinase [Patescibacteria group bacterium]|jgi:phosphoglycerate kinase